MDWFKASFNSFGETIRTLSLVVGLLITSVTGVGYAYTLISQVNAHDAELTSLDSRVKAIESEQPTHMVNRHRLSQVEEAVKGLKQQGDRTWDFLQEFRAEVNRNLPPKP